MHDQSARVLVLGGTMRSIGLRIAAGLAALAPVIVIGGVLTVIVTGVRFESFSIVRASMVAMVASLLAYAGALGWFLYMVHREPTFEAADRARWTYILLLWFPIGAIVFWIRYVWRSPSRIG